MNEVVAQLPVFWFLSNQVKVVLEQVETHNAVGARV